MPMRKPMTPASTPPKTMARIRRRVALSTVPFSKVASTTPEKAPMPMKPAWPRLSSPQMPTSRFKETASTM